MTSPDLAVLLITGAAVLVGALVQSGVGLGVGLVAGPVLTLLDPTLMPGTLILISVVLPVLTLRHEAGHVDWPGLRWVFAGRVLGTAGGVWVVAHLSTRALSLGVGVMVLVAVALTVQAVRIRRSAAALAVAGLVGGVSGTATSIGGPPVAVVYQHATGPQVRATLGAYFLGGNALSLLLLGLAGQLSRREVVTGGLLIPCVLAGFALAGPLRRYLDGGRTRIAVLSAATVSATVLIVRNL